MGFHFSEGMQIFYITDNDTERSVLLSSNAEIREMRKTC